MIHEQVITLVVPFDPENTLEDVPARWDWTVLADTPAPVQVLDAHEPTESPRVDRKAAAKAKRYGDGSVSS